MPILTETAELTFDAIDWTVWEPVDRATLLFVIREGKILLIEKKRGLGAGKINGPGGRIEPGETAAQGAVREVEEELLVTPSTPRHIGDLSFQFLDGYSIHGDIFRSDTCAGEPRETDEAVPLWTPIDAIPYERMWADDPLWFPFLLSETRFRGVFLFDRDVMLGHRIEVIGD
jgi:8-oxo-dGTP diphosphatase